MSALHKAAQLALEALEYGQHSLKQISEYQWESRGQLAMDALKAALDAALKAQAGCDTETDCTSQPWCRISGECHRKQEQKQVDPVQVHPSQFIQLIKGKEDMIGVPVYWAEWPSKETT